MKNLASFLILLFSVLTYAQNSIGSFEKYPVFSECSDSTIENLENCFNNTIQQFVFANFKSPDIVFSEKYNGSITVFFEVDKEGNFKVLYVDAVYNELKDEAREYSIYYLKLNLRLIMVTRLMYSLQCLCRFL